MDNHYNLTRQGKNFFAAFNRINNELQLYQLAMLVLNLKRIKRASVPCHSLTAPCPFSEHHSFFLQRIHNLTQTNFHFEIKQQAYGHSIKQR